MSSIMNEILNREITALTAMGESERLLLTDKEYQYRLPEREKEKESERDEEKYVG